MNRTNVVSRESIRRTRDPVGWAVPTIPSAMPRCGGHGPPYSLRDKHGLQQAFKDIEGCAPGFTRCSLQRGDPGD